MARVAAPMGPLLPGDRGAAEGDPQEAVLAHVDDAMVRVSGDPRR